MEETEIGKLLENRVNCLKIGKEKVIGGIQK